MADKNATLTVGDNSYDLPIMQGSEGPDVIDIRKLYAASDHFTFDPGFTSTASCESALRLLMATKASFCIADTPSKSCPNSLALWKCPICF